MAVKKIHFSLEEKIKIIQQEISWCYQKQAEQIARQLDSLAFYDLKKLVKALQIIAKGK